MRVIRENKLSKEIARIEGGKQNLSIAQIKEVQRILLGLLRRRWRNCEADSVADLMERRAPDEDIVDAEF